MSGNPQFSRLIPICLFDNLIIAATAYYNQGPCADSKKRTEKAGRALSLRSRNNSYEPGRTEKAL